MASIGSPIKGPLININATTVSRSVISGGGGGGLVKRDESALVAKQTAIVAQQTNQIVSLRDQIQTVRVEVLNINNGLNGIGAQLAADSALEKQQILVDKENDRKLNERKVRIGKENQLEAKITSALLKPIASIQQKVGGVFSRIMSAIQILFLGWLTNQGIEALKANAAGNKTKLQQIFQAIVNGVTAAGRGFLFVNRVFGNITRLIINVTKGIVRLTAGLIGGIFRGIADLTKMGIEGVKGLLGIGGKAATTAVKTGTEAAAKTAGKLGIKGTLGKIPVLSLGTAAVFGGIRLAQGDTTGAAMEAASGLAATIPGYGTAGSIGIDAAIVARDFGAFKGTPLEKNQPENVQPTPSKAGAYPQTQAVPQQNTKSSKKSQAPSQPQAPIAPTVNNFQLGMIGPTAQNAQEQSAATTTSQEQSPQTLQFNIPQAQVQTPQVTPPNVGALPEAKPNLIMAQSAVAANNQPQTPPSSKPLTDVPLINSSNPDNFYTLYSQVNYNVVM
jgi:hypothetical protein